MSLAPPHKPFPFTMEKKKKRKCKKFKIPCKRKFGWHFLLWLAACFGCFCFLALVLLVLLSVCFTQAFMFNSETQQRSRCCLQDQLVWCFCGRPWKPMSPSFVQPCNTSLPLARPGPGVAAGSGAHRTGPRRSPRPVALGWLRSRPQPEHSSSTSSQLGHSLGKGTDD